MKNFLFAIILLTIQPSFAQVVDSNWIFGVTIDDPWTNTTAIVDAFANHCQKPTARIVFDENVAATEYTDAVTAIANKAFILGEILDSYYVKNYSVSQYLDRTTEYLDEFENMVDIWEIGNEINGDWLGTTSDVVQKMEGAYNLVEARGLQTELTLYYNNSCYYDYPENEMFTWVNANVPTEMKQNLDYVLISYYEDDCENVVLSEAEWQVVFDDLHAIFPNAKIGMGECGTTNTAQKEAYINRYYRMNITTPNYIGGYFWWYYATDCVPKTNNLWGVINTTSCDHLALPVAYTEQLHGQVNSQKIDLFWATSLEINADYFCIERLAPNGHWQTLETVPAGKFRYHAFDPHPLNGENTYRLKQVDLDYQSSYSNAVSFWYEHESIAFWPNPAHDIFYFESKKDPIHRILIKNTLNQTVLDIQPPNNSINIEGLSPGIYTVLFQGDYLGVMRLVVR